MGAEAHCRIRVNGKSVRGKARLETDVLHLRGADLKLDLPFTQRKKVRAADGALSFNAAAVAVTLDAFDGPAHCRTVRRHRRVARPGT